MEYIYTGKRYPYKEGVSIVTGFLLLVFVVSISIFFYLSDAEAILDRWFELTGISLMLIAFLVKFLKSKAKKITANITLHSDGIWLAETGKIPFERLNLALYIKAQKFSRYHLWDGEGQLAIYSVFEDELQEQLLEKVRNIREHEIVKVSRAGEGGFEITIGQGERFLYNLESGGFELSGADREVMILPRFFMVDPEFKSRKRMKVEA